MENKIKVVFLFGALGGGGAQRQFGWLIDGIDKTKFEPVIISIGDKESVYKKHLDKFPEEHLLDEVAKKDEFSKFLLYRKLKSVCRMLFVERSSFFKTQKEIYSCLKVEKPQIVFFVTPMAAMYGGLPSWRYNKAKIVHGVRGNGILLHYEKSIANVYHWCSQIYVNRFVGNSHALIKNAHKSGILKSKTNCIYNGVPEFYDDHVFSENESVKIGYIGRFESVKNHDLFLRAISQINKQHNFSVHLFGSGSLETTLKKQAKLLEIDTKVVFEGWATDVSQVLKELDIVCLTSDFEGFNNSISEAQMHGIPVVSTDCTGSNEIVENDVTGFVVPKRDVKSFALRLEQLITDSNLRQKFSVAAYKRSRQSFTIKKMCENYERFFTQLNEK